MSKHLDDEEDKLFFTTSDLLNRINSVIDSESKKNDQSIKNAQPRFELQRRLPGGQTRKANADESAAADFQAKLKQVGR